MAKPPPYGGNSSCFLAINDKLSKAVPSPWPASLKPPPRQHPPSPSSPAGPSVGKTLVERKAGAEGAAKGGDGRWRGSEGRGETGDEGAGGERVRKAL